MLEPEERVKVLTGRATDGDSAALVRKIGAHLHNRLTVMEQAMREDRAIQECHADTLAGRRVGQESLLKSQPGHRGFDAQAAIFCKALLLVAEDVRKRAAAMLASNGSINLDAYNRLGKRDKDHRDKHDDYVEQQARIRKEGKLPPGTPLLQDAVGPEPQLKFLLPHWTKLSLTDRFKFVMKYSSLPGTSRHHWGTDVDLISASSAWWKGESPKPPKSKADEKKQANEAAKAKALIAWFEENGPDFGFTTVFSDRLKNNRPCGYEHEPWHQSETRLSRGIAEIWQQEMETGAPGETGLDRLLPDIAEKLSSLQTSICSGARIGRQFEQAEAFNALKEINLREYIHGIAPQAKP